MNISEPSKFICYSTSEVEMNRRKRAFITFLISIYITICIFSCKAIELIPKIMLPILFLLAVIFIILVIGLDKTLNNQSKLQIQLSKNEICWQYISSIDKYSLEDIKSIRIKRTTRGTVREIRLGMKEGKFRYINGLEEFDGFVEKLIGNVNKAKIMNFKEIIDFDHCLFYVVLGFIIGIGNVSLFKILFLLDSKGLKITQIIIACYLIFAGLFIIINKPIRGRYGNKGLIVDYLSGWVCIGFSLVCIIKICI